MTSHYSRLGPIHDGPATDIPLSDLNNRPYTPTGDVYKLPDYRGTFSSTATVPHFKKRGFIGALNGWWLELGSVVLAFCTMLVTVVLLAHYNGKELSQTPRRPNLNTLVNIFSTIVASLLVFVSAESKLEGHRHRVQLT